MAGTCISEYAGHGCVHVCVYSTYQLAHHSLTHSERCLDSTISSSALIAFSKTAFTVCSLTRRRYPVILFVEQIDFRAHLTPDNTRQADCFLSHIARSVMTLCTASRLPTGPYNRPISIYCWGEMPIQSCGVSVSAPRGKAGARLNAHTELRVKRQRSAREAIYGNRPILPSSAQRPPVLSLKHLKSPETSSMPTVQLKR